MLFASSTLNITGTVGGIGTSIFHGAGGLSTNVTITGNVGPGAFVAQSNTNTINVIGNITAGASTCIIFNNGINNNLTVTGNLTAASGFPAVTVGTGALTAVISGNLINASGSMAIQTPTLFLGNTGPQFWDFTTSNLLVNRRLYTADTLPGVPSTTNVRSGSVYGASNELTGTLAMATPDNVRKSVPTDNTVGTAQLTAEDILNEISSSLNPVAVRLRNAATVASTGAQIAGFNI
jgi:hypothetical protein